MATDAGLVLFPKFTTLVSTGSNETSFTTTPIDVSQFGSAQFQFWRGAIQTSSVGTFKIYLEESLDGDTWSSPPGGAGGYDPGENASKNFSYSFRFRWFRVRVDFQGDFVTCWAEGLLR